MDTTLERMFAYTELQIGELQMRCFVIIFIFFTPPAVRSLFTLELDMDLETYQPLAIRTAKLFGNQRLDLQHAALGLATEFCEMTDAKTHDEVDEEAGDLLWYCALLCHTMDTTLERMFAYTDPVGGELQMLAQLGKVINFVKRVAIYEKPITAELRHQFFVDFSQFLQGLMGGLPEEAIHKILRGNIDKLKLRYPDKYSDQAAEARADKGGLGPEVS